MILLETERLVLRAPQACDVPDLAAALNDFEVTKNLAMVPHPYGEDDARAYVARAVTDLAKGETWRFVMRRKTDNALIGCCGLHLKHGQLDLGYWIARAHWRQGYASETARRAVEFAFDDLGADELHAGWYHDNGISGRILAGLGFRAVRVEKQFSAARGHDVLANRCRLLRADFERLRAEEPEWPRAVGA